MKELTKRETPLTYENVIRECVKIAVKNGCQYKECTIERFAYFVCECPFKYLYDTSNGFAKALFGEDSYSQLGNVIIKNCDGYLFHLRAMVGQDPIEYLRNWLKQRGSK